MTRSSLLALLLGALSGACVSLVVVLSVSPSGDSDGGPAAPEFDASRLIALEQENATLRARLDVLEDQPRQISRREHDAPTRSEFDALEARLAPLTGATPGDESAGSFSNVDRAVDYALEQRAEEARLEKARQVEEDRDRRVDKQVARWTDQLSLSSYQAEEMTGLVRARDEGIGNLKTSIASGELPQADAGEAWQQIEAEYNDGLSFLLLPSQLETYQANARGK